MENLIYTILLAVHNIALVGCVAAPFYMGRVVRERAKYGKKISYQMDKLVEGVITTQPKYCWMFLGALYVTGMGFPIVHYLYHGAFMTLSTIALTALIIKNILVLGLATILFVGTVVYNPKLKALFAKFSPDTEPDEAVVKEFFALRALRKKWCDRCLTLGLLVLIVTPFMVYF